VQWTFIEKGRGFKKSSREELKKRLKKRSKLVSRNKEVSPSKKTN